MSYGAISENAIRALNLSAGTSRNCPSVCVCVCVVVGTDPVMPAMGNYYHNTGEGGVSRFHLEHGGDIVWNIGTAYFGCRSPDGRFDPGKFAETAALDNIKMIELKLSQGAKPAHGQQRWALITERSLLRPAFMSQAECCRRARLRRRSARRGGSRWIAIACHLPSIRRSARRENSLPSSALFASCLVENLSASSSA